MSQYARIRNVGTETWNDGQPGHPYSIPPGGEVMVPWDIMCVWLGDPNARDSAKEPERANEISRLHIRYGVNSAVAGDDRPGWADAMPKLEAFDVDGTPLATVAAHPEGATAPAATPILSPAEASTRIAWLQEELAKLSGGHTPTPAAVEQSELNPATEADTTSMPPADGPARRKNQR